LVFPGQKLIRTVVVSVEFRHHESSGSAEEAVLLAQSAGADVVDVVCARRDKPHAATFLGSGKVAELREMVRRENIDLVVFNHAITPVQQRNVENELKCRIIDRTTLILDIFAQRAKTHEGKVQVELAQLTHLSTRLVRGWTHLERQKGGIGLRGPGETQLETDRRLLSFRVKALKKKLATIEKQRSARRKSRSRRNVLKISLVGYTNAGKSTLFNRLTNEKVLSADQLFATLDTTTRKLAYLDGVEIVLSDTVGFVKDLPHSLIEAFKATLEETAESDVLFHVIDDSSDNRDLEFDQVQRVLKEIGADHVPQILIRNKIDIAGRSSGIERGPCGNIIVANLSALTGTGIDDFRKSFGELITLKKALDLGAGSKNSSDGLRLINNTELEI
jgi:GTP-binding protein HflX